MKKEILGLHIRGNANLGDNYCHPLDYFNVGCDLDIALRKASLTDPPLDMEPDCVVLGGGAVSRRAPDVRKLYPKSKLVAWGVGYTTRKEIKPVPADVHYRLRSGYALYGCRDYVKGSGLDYVPCVSCMHPYFDSIPEPVHELVVYGHRKLGDLSAEAAAMGAPYADNMSGLDLFRALDHLASGSTVVTSSYHGAYWATLLGRKVAMVPFGSKFMSLKFRPATVEGVKGASGKAVRFDEALGDSRDRNIAFRERVLDLIWS
ncbi:hypothetical protein QF205_13460 [Luteimonas composti]|uniref:Polysaccharide pyruvyl transferase family protein n=1 Tax=Luteimonas composti TaxID=398257 RepID=A0ABT6MUE5_9GAMM|nr:hypothetical protein [Luteimonas composti]MDH7454068.1 hypothetical protein [Luteimonas composti]